MKVKRPAKIKFDSPTPLEIEDLCYRLAKRIKRSRYSFDVIVAIGRGGWIPARYLADYLGNIMNVASVKVEHYTGIDKRAKARITQNVSTNVRGMNVLLVDDVSDSGDSLIIAKRHLLKRGARKVRIAALHHKPWSAIRPDFFVKETTCWVIYPWMYKENLEELKRSGKDLERTGIPRRTIKRLLNI
jgi:hypoxanthine phosphoribosyltransferase